MSKKHIHHVATGGTIDSVWDAAEDTSVPRTLTIIPKYLREAARIKELTSQTLYLKDSRDISVDDKRLTTATVAESGYKNIVLTSGTYLMAEMTNRIHRQPFVEQMETFDRRIAVTGSIIPIDGFEASDGGFNLGMSIAVLRSETPHRIALVMNGRVFDPSDVEKDLTKATFTSDSGTDLLDYETLTVIPAGGSIDFEFNGLDRFVPAQHSFVTNYLRHKVRTDRNINATPPILRDSRELTNEDIDTIIDIARSSTQDRILITMGIYRLQEIAKKIKAGIEGLSESKPTIGITGSRLPLRLSGMTDAPFNVGFACGHLGLTEPGIHVSLGGQIFNPEDDIISAIYTPEEIKQIEEQQLKV
jgi:L-asparaginase/Glu-tRNA(Gln) amidotransferase subunit D